MGKYSLRALLDKEPVAIAGTIRSLLYTAVLLGAVTLDAGQLAAIAIALELILGLFARASSTPNASIPEAPDPGGG